MSEGAGERESERDEALNRERVCEKITMAWMGKQYNELADQAIAAYKTVEDCAEAGTAAIDQLTRNEIRASDRMVAFFDAFSKVALQMEEIRTMGLRHTAASKVLLELLEHFESTGSLPEHELIDSEMRQEFQAMVERVGRGEDPSEGKKRASDLSERGSERGSERKDGTTERKGKKAKKSILEALANQDPRIPGVMANIKESPVPGFVKLGVTIDLLTEQMVEKFGQPDGWTPETQKAVRELVEHCEGTWPGIGMSSEQAKEITAVVLCRLGLELCSACREEGTRIHHPSLSH